MDKMERGADESRTNPIVNRQKMELNSVRPFQHRPASRRNKEYSNKFNNSYPPQFAKRKRGPIAAQLDNIYEKFFAADKEEAKVCTAVVLSSFPIVASSYSLTSVSTYTSSTSLPSQSTSSSSSLPSIVCQLQSLSLSSHSSATLSSSSSSILTSSSSSCLLSLSSSLESITLSEKSLQCFVDTHCHLDMILQEKVYGTKNESLLEYFPASLESVITNVVFPETLLWLNDFLALEKTNKSDSRIYWTIGFHPKAAAYYDEFCKATVTTLLNEKRCVGIGECGLDYTKINISPAEKQKVCFRDQCRIAVFYNKPLVVHTRNAEEDTLRIMMDLLPKSHIIHMHCFTGELNFLKLLLDTYNNLYVGFTGLITFSSNNYENRNKNESKTKKNNEIQRYNHMEGLVCACPLKRILVETDSPYMAPHPYRNCVCQPGMVLFVINKISQLKRIKFSKAVKQIRINTFNVYGV